jgi:hypothetical protein
MSNMGRVYAFVLTASAAEKKQTSKNQGRANSCMAGAFDQSSFHAAVRPARLTIPSSQSGITYGIKLELMRVIRGQI